MDRSSSLSATGSPHACHRPTQTTVCQPRKCNTSNSQTNTHRRILWRSANRSPAHTARQRVLLWQPVSSIALPLAKELFRCLHQPCLHLRYLPPQFHWLPQCHDTSQLCVSPWFQQLDKHWQNHHNSNLPQWRLWLRWSPKEPIHYNNQLWSRHIVGTSPQAPALLSGCCHASYKYNGCQQWFDLQQLGSASIFCPPLQLSFVSQGCTNERLVFDTFIGRPEPILRHVYKLVNIHRHESNSCCRQHFGLVQRQLGYCRGVG